MKHELGLQLYTLRDLMQDEAGIAKCFAEMHNYGYTKAQTATELWNIPTEKFAALAQENGIQIVGTHISWDKFQDIDEVVRIHKILGTTNAGVGGMYDIKGKDLAFLKERVKQVNEVAAKLADHGMKFTYHHHAFEFGKLEDGTRPMDVYTDGFDENNVSFVLDTYWLQHAGVTPAPYIASLAGRIDVLHLKDKGVRHDNYEPFITEFGNGNMDFDSVMEVADDIGIPHIVIEQDFCWGGDPLASIALSAKNFFEKY